MKAHPAFIIISLGIKKKKKNKQRNIRGTVAMLCYYKADPDEGRNGGMAAVPPLLPLTLILQREHTST